MAKPGRKPNYARHLQSLQQSMVAVSALEPLTKYFEQLIADNEQLKQERGKLALENHKLRRQIKNLPKPVSEARIKAQIAEMVPRMIQDALGTTMKEIMGPNGVSGHLRLLQKEG